MQNYKQVTNILSVTDNNNIPTNRY